MSRKRIFVPGDLKRLEYRREVRPSDRDDVRFVVESSGFFSAEEVDVAVELVDERLRRGPASGYEFLFAELSGMILGYTCFGPIPCTVHSYDLYWIAVREDFRGLGIGQALLAESEGVIAALHGKRIYVETSSRAQYASTRRFYELCGYRKEAFLEDFYAPGDAKVIVVKTV
ncbi:MAG: GNAT family N-acetyltransferase [Syntrophobacteraceae bacterium]|nr:GNAT family N-acetyltransferase [Desulfobacteraceae bacterium]